MRFVVMHKTNAHWETGARPSPDLVAGVGAMMGELQQQGVLLDAAGLRPTSEGARIRLSQGKRTVTSGPFTGEHELLAGFTIVQTRSLDDAIEVATAQAAEFDSAEMDVRPVTEPWDIGLTERPADLTTRRYMILRKATPESERDQDLAADPTRLTQTTDPAVPRTHVTVTMRPSSRGRRYKNSENGITYSDGPFTETKEMIGGYVTVSAASLDHVDPVVRRYIETVGAEEVDVRELEAID
jgi:hypothetical protein